MYNTTGVVTPLDTVSGTTSDSSDPDTLDLLFANPATDMSSYVNDSELTASIEPISEYGVVSTVILAIVVGIVCLSIVLGNSLVVIAICTERALKSTQNWLLISLAASDIALGALVIPFSLSYELMGYWYFGAILCELWQSLDVLACTASILNICAIALDRYWSITQPIQYAKKRTPRRIMLMIVFLWVLSLVICIPPLLGWKAGASTAPQEKPMCELPSENIGYVIYSTSFSFFIPMFVMVIVYVRIYQAARRRARSNVRASSVSETASTTSTSVPPCYNCKRYAPVAQTDTRKLQPYTITTTKLDNVSMNGDDMDREDTTEREPRERTESNSGDALHGHKQVSRIKSILSWKKEEKAPEEEVIHDRRKEIEKHKRKIAQARERKATLVLGAIMGAFICCWFPFFATYVITSLCGEPCNGFPGWLFGFFFWLGYCNSCFNPIIYTIFNNDFRRAFFRILFNRRC